MFCPYAFHADDAAERGADFLSDRQVTAKSPGRCFQPECDVYGLAESGVIGRADASQIANRGNPEVDTEAELEGRVQPNCSLISWSAALIRWTVENAHCSNVAGFSAGASTQTAMTASPMYLWVQAPALLRIAPVLQLKALISSATRFSPNSTDRPVKLRMSATSTTIELVATSSIVSDARRFDHSRAEAGWENCRVQLPIWITSP